MFLPCTCLNVATGLPSFEFQISPIQLHTVWQRQNGWLLLLLVTLKLALSTSSSFRGQRLFSFWKSTGQWGNTQPTINVTRSLTHSVTDFCSVCRAGPLRHSQKSHHWLQSTLTSVSGMLLPYDVATDWWWYTLTVLPLLYDTLPDSVILSSNASRNIWN